MTATHNNLTPIHESLQLADTHLDCDEFLGLNYRLNIHTAKNAAITACICQQDYFRKVTGLPISPYFSAYKFRWLVENVEEQKNLATKLLAAKK